MVSATRSKRKGAAEPARETGSCTKTVKKRARVALACQRCKFRKQKCDGGQPDCTNCVNSGYQCEYIIPTKSYPYGKTEYTKALEDRIALLESKLSDECLEQLESNYGGSPQSSRRNSVQSNMVSASTQTEERYFSSSSPMELKTEPLSLSPTPTPTPPLLPSLHRLPSTTNTLPSNGCDDPIARSSRGSFDGWIWQDSAPPEPIPGVFTGSYDGENGYLYLGQGMDHLSGHNVHATSNVSFGYQENPAPFWGRHDGGGWE